jgi:ferredoxin-NADP reductase
MKISAKKNLTADTVEYTLIADTEKGGKRPAYFRAGQYVSVLVDTGRQKVRRPYSLASSPKEAREGVYRIAVKRVTDGFASLYILDNYKAGDFVEVSAPEGTFCYEPMRDHKTVVGLAGGSGITPFMSMARSITEGTSDFELILLYGCRTEKDILYRAEFDAMAAECKKIRVVYVMSDEDAKDCEKGFITAELINKYAPRSYSVFVCGPLAMYRFVSREIVKLGLRPKDIRFELFGETKNPAACEGYPAKLEKEVFALKVITHKGEYKTECRAAESLVLAMERAGIPAPTRCRSGECGYCRSKLVSGKVFTPPDADGRRMADKKFGYIHPCAAFPLSDVVIELPFNI